MKRLLVLFLLLGVNVAALSQNRDKLDSLTNLLKKLDEDTMRVRALCALTWELRGNDHAAAAEYGKEALLLAQKLSYPHGINLSMSFLGVVRRNSGDFPGAMEYFFEALRIAEKHNLLREQGYAFNNIGDIFRYQGDDRQALEYTKKALEIFERIKDKRGTAYAHVRIGEIYQNLKDYAEALSHFEQSLQIRLEIQEIEGIQTSYNRIGNIQRLMKNFDKALEFFEKADAVSEKTKDTQSRASNLSDMAQTFLDKGDYQKAFSFGHKARAMLEGLKATRNMITSYQLLTELYTKTKRYDSALYYQNKFIEVKDALMNEKNINLIGRAQSNYQLEKKQQEIDLINKERQLEEVFRYAITAVLVLMVVVAVILYPNNQEKKKVNNLLMRQNNEIKRQREETESIAEKLRVAHHEISAQKALVDAKSEDMQASIMYAKRIQSAMLPTLHQVNKILPDSFIFFKPRDIVSGDFYWVTKVGDKTIIVAADCTGHGVPGAFMSMIGMNLINEMIKVLGITKPEIILSGLNAGVRDILNQATTQNQDGMDVSVVVIDRQKNTLEFAAAKHSLLYAYLDEKEQITELIQVQGNREAIGGDLENSKKNIFKAHTIDASRPLVFYMFSDGYQDQFGGREGRKFMKKRLRDLLFSIHHFPLEKQLEYVEESFAEWVGTTHKQVDDILVIGVKHTPNSRA